MVSFLHMLLWYVSQRSPVFSITVVTNTINLERSLSSLGINIKLRIVGFVMHGHELAALIPVGAKTHI